MSAWLATAARGAGDWRSYGEDFANSRSQSHPDGIGAATASRLRERFAIRRSGVAHGATPSVTSTPAVADAAIELISTAESWLADRGVDRVWTPYSHSLRQLALRTAGYDEEQAPRPRYPGQAEVVRGERLTRELGDASLHSRKQERGAGAAR